MLRIILFLLLLTTLFDSMQSISFQCEYTTGSWGTLGTIYYCQITNAVSITTLEAAQIDGMTGAHKPGLNDDSVLAFYDVGKGQIHYFPRGITKHFKNLKGMHIYNSGLKEIHKNDLKPFPKLANLYLHNNQLEVLEENLFEFNPNLDYINLSANKISHVDSNVFDKLFKLKTLDFSSNLCINMETSNNPTEIQNIIKITKTHCNNSDYLTLLQNVKSLEIASKSLTLDKLREKIEILENEVKNSRFENFFTDKLQGLKAVQVEAEKDAEIQKIISGVKNLTSFDTLETKIDKMAIDLQSLTVLALNGSGNEQLLLPEHENLSELSTYTKMDTSLENSQNSIVSFLKKSAKPGPDATTVNSKLVAKMSKLEEENHNLNIKVEILEENLNNFKMFCYKKFGKIEIEEKIVHSSLKKASENSIEEVEMKVGGIEAKIDEMERKFEEKLEKILKNLGV